jgi:hypothetical protein
LIKREKNERRRRGRKNKHKHKKLDRKVTVKNNGDTVVTSSSDRMVDEVTGKIKDTSVTEVAEVCRDYGVANDCVPNEAASIGATENKIEEDNTSKKETEKSCSENPGAVSRMKRKCGLLLTDFENLVVGPQPLKVRRKDSPMTLKVAKDKKSEGDTKRLRAECNITAKSSTSRGRVSVGGDWEVTDVAESNMKVS